MMMFSTLALPISSASSVIGAFTTLISVRVISLLTMELLMYSVPPGTSLYRNLLRLGSFMTIRSSI